MINFDSELHEANIENLQMTETNYNLMTKYSSMYETIKDIIAQKIREYNSNTFFEHLSHEENYVITDVKNMFIHDLPSIEYPNNFMILAQVCACGYIFEGTTTNNSDSDNSGSNIENKNNKNVPSFEIYNLPWYCCPQDANVSLRRKFYDTKYSLIFSNAEINLPTQEIKFYYNALSCSSCKICENNFILVLFKLEDDESINQPMHITNSSHTFIKTSRIIDIERILNDVSSLYISKLYNKQTDEFNIPDDTEDVNEYMSILASSIIDEQMNEYMILNKYILRFQSPNVRPRITCTIVKCEYRNN